VLRGFPAEWVADKAVTLHLAVVDNKTKRHLQTLQTQSRNRAQLVVRVCARAMCACVPVWSSCRIKSQTKMLVRLLWRPWPIHATTSSPFASSFAWFSSLHPQLIPHNFSIMKSNKSTRTKMMLTQTRCLVN
jgi:cytochrome bd-type quinol oxidase subunit 2